MRSHTVSLSKHTAFVPAKSESFPVNIFTQIPRSLVKESLHLFNQLSTILSLSQQVRRLALAGLGSGLLFLAGSGSAQAQIIIPVKDVPLDIALGDFDGDGNLDMAIVKNSENVSILINKGNGTFAAGQDFGIGDFPQAIAVGDLDGDGDLDLAIATYYQSVSILLNNGDGTFGTPQLFAADGKPVTIAIGDLDGDGDLDLVTGSKWYDGFSVLKNNGDGTFAPYQNVDTPSNTVKIQLGDLDGDGDLDIVTIQGYSEFFDVLKNNGDGTFATAQRFPVGEIAADIVLGDLDGDGDLDIVTANKVSDVVSVVKNDGNGSFTRPQFFTAVYNLSSITLGDLDGDGDLDVATTNMSSAEKRVAVLKNRGNGSFALPQKFGTGDTASVIVAGDLDGDGDLDLATSNASYRTISVLNNIGDGTFVTIFDFTPKNSPVGASVVVTGTRFTGATQVFFGSSSDAAQFTVDSDTQITAIVPTGSTTGSIRVVTPNGIAISGNDFEVSPSPVITNFTPNSGPTGTIVVIEGITLSDTTQVAFGDTLASFTLVNATKIRATVPVGATSGKIRLTTPVGTIASTSNFIVTPSPLPTITSLSTISGASGDSVTITGTGFIGTSTVKFNGLPTSSFTVLSDTQITAIVPVGATTGKITVTTPGGTATSASTFTVVVGSTLKDDFDPIVDFPQWSAINLGFANTLCGAVSGKALYFSGTGARSATTRTLNTQGGSLITFSLKYGTGGTPCENLDPGDEVQLEYSNNGGSTWVLLQTYGVADFANFTTVSLVTPTAARTTNTRFRWIQPTNGNIVNDNWALDNVSIVPIVIP